MNALKKNSVFLACLATGANLVRMWKQFSKTGGTLPGGFITSTVR